MKRIILLTLLIPVLAHAQRYGHTSAGAAGAGSTANVRANTGWTASGTLARDTLYTNYAIFGAKTFGVGGTTQAQNARAKFNVLGRAANDTLAIWSNDGGGVVGDSAVAIDAGGRMGIKTFPSASYGLKVSGGSAANIAAASYEIGAGGSGSLNNTSSGSSVFILGGGTYGGGMSVKIGTGSNPNRGLWVGSTTAGDTSAAIISGNGLTKSGYAVFGKRIRPAVDSRAAFNIEFDALADTLLLISNDANATLDSAFMVFANGDADVGGNNLYLGGHRIRSNAAGDSLIFYDGSTMIFAILSDGSTADLVAGTPPGFRGIPPMEYRILLWVIAILLLILVAWKVFELVAKIKLNRYDTRIERA